MKKLHIVPEVNAANGVFVVAGLLAKEHDDAVVVELDGAMNVIALADDIWVHGMWLPRVWQACWRTLKAGKRLVRMTHGSLSPIYLRRQSPVKKWLVGPIERYFLRKADKIVVTCEAEAAWVRQYLGKKCPKVEVVDLKRFFKLNRVDRVDRVEGRGECGGVVNRVERVDRVEGRAESGGVEECENVEVWKCGNVEMGECENVEVWKCGNGEMGDGGEGTDNQRPTTNNQLHLLYLGRRHPLKGVEFLEQAVKELVSGGVGEWVNSKLQTRNYKLKIVSDAFGEEKERVWEWCDVLVLPTLSENFGLVVAEALERGKRVITTDGAPVWGEGRSGGVEEWVSGGVEECGNGEMCKCGNVEMGNGEIVSGYGGRLLYLKGYREGTREMRVELLKKAIMKFRVSSLKFSTNKFKNEFCAKGKRV